MEESNIEIKKEEYILKFAPEMMDIVFKWC